MATLTITIGLDAMTDDAKDRLIAPKIYQLYAPKIPDIFPQRKYPLNAFIFNLELSMIISNKRRQLVFNIIRKIQDAFDEYCEGRNDLISYVGSDKKTVLPYFSAVRNFEHCLAHAYQTVRCLNALAETFGGPQQYDKGDGSILERVNIIHNDIKHMDNRFENSANPDEISIKSFSSKSSDSTIEKARDSLSNIPMWLTDEGLESPNAKVSYAELSQEILELLEQAKELAYMKPEKRQPKQKSG